MKITEAFSTFVDEELRFRNRADATIEGYEAVFRSLARWAAENGRAFLRDLDETAIRTWMRSWAFRPSTTRQRMAQLKRFFSFAVERGWVPRSPLAALRPPRSDASPTMPLTVRDMRALLAASERQPKERGLILLMRYSGLAIADAVTLCREALVGTELTLRRAKTGELVMVDLPHLVVRTIRRLRGPNPDYFWWSGRGKRVTSAKYWRGRLGEIAARAGVAGFHPHRLRDTFAVALLTAGVSIEDVSSLLGHSSIQTTERHYAPWDRRRRDRLTRVVRAANRLDTLLAELDPLSGEGDRPGKKGDRGSDETDQHETSLGSSHFLEKCPIPQFWAPASAPAEHAEGLARKQAAPPDRRNILPGTRARGAEPASFESYAPPLVRHPDCIEAGTPHNASRPSWMPFKQASPPAGGMLPHIKLTHWHGIDSTALSLYSHA